MTVGWYILAAVLIVGTFVSLLIAHWMHTQRQERIRLAALQQLPTTTPATPAAPQPAAAPVATSVATGHRPSYSPLRRRAVWAIVAIGVFIGLFAVVWWGILPTARSLWTSAQQAVADAGPGRGMTDYPEEKPVEPPKVQPGPLPGRRPTPGILTTPPTQVAQLPRTIKVALPGKGWVPTDIQLEAGLAYPMTSDASPPGTFDYDIGKGYLRRIPGPQFPSDTLRMGLVSHLRADSSGTFSYYFRADDPRCPGTWTFTIGKGIPVDQIREVVVGVRQPRFRDLKKP